MDFLPALPADLVAVADPSARGAAPLLRLATAEATTAVAALPFADFLALLAAPMPAGESWPATGKELPLMPVEPANGEPAPNAPTAVLPMMPFAVAATALPTDLPVEASPLEGSALLPAASKALSATPTDGLPLPTSATAGSADVVPQAALELEPVPASAATEQPLPPLDGAELEAAIAPAKSSAAPSWLEAFTHERRLQRPTSATAVDPRAATASQLPPAATLSAPSSPTTTVVDAANAGPRAVDGVQPGIELPKLFAHAVSGEGASVSQADWLPPTTHGTTTASAAPAAATAAQGAPVDTRSPGWQEAFANRVQWAVDQQAGEAHIKLNPPELGAVDVKISLVDDKTYVQLTTATAAARDELAQSLPRLRELLTVSGLELGGASVHNGRYGQQSGNGYGAEPSAARPFERFAEDRAEPAMFVPRRSAGRIDVFA